MAVCQLILRNGHKDHGLAILCYSLKSVHQPYLTTFDRNDKEFISSFNESVKVFFLHLKYIIQTFCKNK